MAAFQNTRKQIEKKAVVHFLTEIEKNPSFAQRALALKFGIALRLINQYLKNCVTKRWLRASQVSSKRITYFLAPEGFKEKSWMVGQCLIRSLTFFRDVRKQCEEVFAQCKAQNWLKVALVGGADLADITKLVTHGMGVQVETISAEYDLKAYDATLITDIISPQKTYNDIKDRIKPHQLLTLKFLHISRDVS